MQEDTEDFRIYNNCKFVSLNTIVAIFLCFKLRMLMIGKGIFFFMLVYLQTRSWKVKQ